VNIVILSFKAVTSSDLGICGKEYTRPAESIKEIPKTKWVNFEGRFSIVTVSPEPFDSLSLRNVHISDKLSYLLQWCSLPNKLLKSSHVLKIKNIWPYSVQVLLHRTAAWNSYKRDTINRNYFRLFFLPPRRQYYIHDVIEATANTFV
jgi:hypothetical protein